MSARCARHAVHAARYARRTSKTSSSRGSSPKYVTSSSFSFERRTLPRFSGSCTAKAARHDVMSASFIAPSSLRKMADTGRVGRDADADAMQE